MVLNVIKLKKCVFLEVMRSSFLNASSWMIKIVSRNARNFLTQRYFLVIPDREYMLATWKQTSTNNVHNILRICRLYRAASSLHSDNLQRSQRSMFRQLSVFFRTATRTSQFWPKIPASISGCNEELLLSANLSWQLMSVSLHHLQLQTTLSSSFFYDVKSGRSASS